MPRRGEDILSFPLKIWNVWAAHLQQPVSPQAEVSTCFHSAFPNPCFAPVSRECDAHQDTAWALRTVANLLDMGVPRIESGVCGSPLEARIKVQKSSTTSRNELSRREWSHPKSDPSYFREPNYANCWSFGANWRAIDPNISIGGCDRRDRVGRWSYTESRTTMKLETPSIKVQRETSLPGWELVCNT